MSVQRIETTISMTVVDPDHLVRGHRPSAGEELVGHQEREHHGGGDAADGEVAAPFGRLLAQCRH
jgi:hypothetical protein